MTLTRTDPMFVTTDSRSGVSSSTATSSTTSSSSKDDIEIMKRFGGRVQSRRTDYNGGETEYSMAKFRNQESLTTKESRLDDSIEECNPSNFQTSTPKNDSETNKLRDELVFLQRTRRQKDDCR